MYRIIKVDGMEIGITDRVNYIKMGTAECYVLTSHEEAVGISFQNKPYNLIGHNEIEGADTVIISEFDGGMELESLSRKHIGAEQMITDLDIANIEAQQAITELELMILEG